MNILKRLGVTQRNSGVNRGAILTLLASLTAVGCGTRSDVNRTMQEQSLQPRSGEVDDSEAVNTEWQRFEAIGKEMEKMGCTVLWNHPETGPRNPKFIVSNSHTKVHAAEYSQSRIDAQIQEYETLCLLADKGLETFAHEGSDASKPRPGDHFILFPKQDGALGIQALSAELDWQTEVPNSRKLDTTELQSEDFRLNLPGLLANGYSTIVSGAFCAVTTDDPTIKNIGSENPDTFEEYEETITSEEVKNLQHTLSRLSVAIEAVTSNGTFPWKYENDEAGTITHITINGEKFSYSQACAALQFALAQHPLSDALVHQRNEYVANELEADVVLLGTGHIEGLQSMPVQNSIGVIIPPATQALVGKSLYTHQLKEVSWLQAFQDKQAQLLQAD